MEENEGFVCSSCGRLIEADEKYCQHCSAPTNNAFNLDPMTAIESEGHLFARAATGKQKPIVLIGSWIMFFPAIIVLTLFAFGTLSAGAGPPAADFVFFAIGILLAMAFGVILFRITRNYIRSRRFDSSESSDY